MASTPTRATRPDLPPLAPLARATKRAPRATLRESADALDAPNTRVATEKREDAATMIAKHSSITEYDALFCKVANHLVTLFELAAQPELARRVRPSMARPGRTEVPPTE